jgi:hypothetical protein
MRCEDSYLIVRVVYKNPVQQAFSGLSLCLIKNEKSEKYKKHYLQLLRQRIKPEKYYLVFISSRQHWM